MITMNDIAQKVGVSRATVSLVLSGRHAELRISEETRQRIETVAQELGYRANSLARAVASGRNQVLGLLSAAPESESSARILAGALDEAGEHGYFVKALRLHNEAALDDKTLERCLENRLAGLIVLYPRGAWLEKLRSEMARHRVPVAVADDSREAQGVGIHVLTDYGAAMEQAVAHLENLGHDKIALLAGEVDDLASQEREMAFRDAMRRRALPLPSEYVAHAAWEDAPIADATRRLLSLESRPTAIVSSVDTGGLHLMRTARQLGVEVPRDLSVVALGNPRVGAWGDPPLTIVAQPFMEIGRTAMRLLLNRIEHSSADENWQDAPLLERLPTKLVARASSAALLE